jgi:predicted ATP-dependent endonuclease of OLD family
LRRQGLKSPTVACECDQDLFKDLGLKKRLSLAKLFDANVNKMFFADKIVLVEGDEDVIALTQTAKDCGCFSHRVTVVNAGGKGNIPSLQRVLNAFKIPYTVVYDVDPCDTKSPQKNEAIEQLVSQLAAFGLCASMPMYPDLPTVMGYGATKDGKATACVKFLEASKPEEEFVKKVMTLYELPAAGVITPQ